MRDLTHDITVVTQALQVIYTFGCLVTYVQARARGMHDAAAAWFKLFTAAKPATEGSKLLLARTNLTPMGWLLPLRTLSFLLTGVQLVQGIAMLFGSDKDSDTLQGGFLTLLGAAGVPGVLFTTFNVRWLAFLSGPASAWVLSVGLGTHIGRNDARGVDIENSVEHVNVIFRMLAEGSAEVAKDANALETTLRFRDETLKGSTGEAGAVAASAQRRAEEQTIALRDSMVLVFLDLANPGLGVPGHIKRPFESVKRRADRAVKSPVGMLEAAVAFLTVVQDLLEHFERTVARTLQERDKDTVGELGAHPERVVLVGLHDDPAITTAAAYDEKLPGPVSRHRPTYPGSGVAGALPNSAPRPRGTNAPAETR